MLKIVLLIVTFSFFSLLGYSFSLRYKKRYYFLNQFNKWMILMQNEVIYNHTPLPEAIKLTSEKTAQQINNMLKILLVNLQTEGNDGIYSAFEKAYKQNENQLYLKKEDIIVISDFIKSLGGTGVYGQDKIFNFALGNMKINLSEALEESNKNSKLCRNLGMCIGAMAVILLI